MNKSISSLIKWNDHHFLIIDKPATIPVQTDLTGDKSIGQLAEIYSKTKLHAITRLDRPASGLCLFGKSPDDVSYVQALLKNGELKKTYVILVEGIIKEDKGTLTDLLVHNKKLKKSIVTKVEGPDAKKAKLDFEVILRFERYTALRVVIHNGRFHQIRSQFANYGFPIKGDVKYGARRKNKDRSIYLNCHSISLKTQIGKKEINCISDLPADDTLWKETQKIINGKS